MKNGHVTGFVLIILSALFFAFVLPAHYDAKNAKWCSLYCRKRGFNYHNSNRDPYICVCQEKGREILVGSDLWDEVTSE